MIHWVTIINIAILLLSATNLIWDWMPPVFGETLDKSLDVLLVIGCSIFIYMALV